MKQRIILAVARWLIQYVYGWRITRTPVKKNIVKGDLC